MLTEVRQMNHYFLPVEKEQKCALNSIWAIIYEEKIKPEMLHLMFTENDDIFEDFIKNIKTIIEHYDLNCEVDAIIIEQNSELDRLIEKHKDKDSKFVLDISGASKHLASKILCSVDKDIFDHIFLTDVKANDEDKWFPTIENEKVNVMDLKKSEKEVE